MRYCYLIWVQNLKTSEELASKNLLLSDRREGISRFNPFPDEYSKGFTATLVVTFRGDLKKDEPTIIGLIKSYVEKTADQDMKSSEFLAANLVFHMPKKHFRYLTQIAPPLENEGNFNHVCNRADFFYGFTLACEKIMRHDRTRQYLKSRIQDDPSFEEAASLINPIKMHDDVIGSLKDGTLSLPEFSNRDTVLEGAIIGREAYQRYYTLLEEQRKRS